MRKKNAQRRFILTKSGKKAFDSISMILTGVGCFDLTGVDCYVLATADPTSLLAKTTNYVILKYIITSDWCSDKGKPSNFTP